MYEVELKTQPKVLEMCLGRDGCDILDSLPAPKTTFTEIVARMDEYFKVNSSLLLRRRDFLRAVQGMNECAVEYACRLRRLANACDFSADKASLMRDFFVVGLSNQHFS